MRKRSRVIEGLVVCWFGAIVMIATPDLRLGGIVAALVLGAWTYLRTGKGLGHGADSNANRGPLAIEGAAALCCVVAAAGIMDALWIHRALQDPPPVLVGVLLYAALPATAVALFAGRAGASAGRWAVLYLALMALGGVGWLIYTFAACGENCIT